MKQLFLKTATKKALTDYMETLGMELNDAGLYSDGTIGITWLGKVAKTKDEDGNTLTYYSDYRFNAWLPDDSDLFSQFSRINPEPETPISTYEWDI